MKNILDVCLSSAVWRSSWPRKCCHDYTSCFHSRGCCSSSSFHLPPATASQRISPNKSKQFMLHMSLALALGIQMPGKYNFNVCVHIHLEFLCIFNIYLPEHSTHKIELDASKLQDDNLVFVGKIFTWPGSFFEGAHRSRQRKRKQAALSVFMRALKSMLQIYALQL